MNPKLDFWLKNSEEQAQKHGNTIAAHDYLSERVFRMTQSYLFELFKEKEGLSILDVGCGNGLFTCPLSERHRVIGLDMSPSMLKLSRQNGVRPVRALAERLPFADGAFDAACCVEMLQCVENGDEIVREMARVVRPGGFLFVQTLNRASLVRKVHRFFDRESKLLRMYEVGEIMKYSNLPELRLRRIVYNYYPFPWKKKCERPSALRNLAATSFAVIADRT